MTTSNNPQLANMNRLGEQLRMSGEFTGAIEQFDKVLKQEPHNAWTLAHRGAAKLSMGQLTTSPRSDGPGAIEDLKEAVRLRENYPWALARLGEAYRSLARNRFPELMKAGDYKELLALTDRAEKSFDQVIDGQKNNIWALAHRGATRALTFMVKKHQWMAEHPEDKQLPPEVMRYYREAEEDLEQAIQLNPSYPWALASYGFLLTLQEQFGKAREVADRAAAADTQHRLHVARTMCQLFYYEGQLDSAVTRGWEALRANPEDFMARYFLAASMVSKERSPVALAFMESTFQELLEVRSVVDHLLASARKHLGLLAGGPVHEHPVPETLGFSLLDPVWENSARNARPTKPSR